MILPRVLPAPLPAMLRGPGAAGRNLLTDNRPVSLTLARAQTGSFATAADFTEAVLLAPGANLAAPLALARAQVASFATAEDV
jgi:hypothetical protein